MGCAALCNEYAGNGLDPGESVDLIDYALDAGINLFDTAPTYGDSEIVTGMTVADRGYVCTKFSEDETYLSGTADIVLGHNHVPAGRISGAVFGASVYEPNETVEAIARKLDVVQFPYNLLDRRHEFALTSDIGTMARSILLRGKLASMAEDAIRWGVFGTGLYPKVPDTCLIGFTSKEEIDFAVEALEKGPIDWEEITDPRRWD